MSTYAYQDCLLQSGLLQSESAAAMQTVQQLVDLGVSLPTNKQRA